MNLNRMLKAAEMSPPHSLSLYNSDEKLCYVPRGELKMLIEKYMALSGEYMALKYGEQEEKY